ncbi:MAG: TetR/AcrR family transcriptional regulator [Homoserinimonas sp.]
MSSHEGQVSAAAPKMRKKDPDKRRALLLEATASCIRELGIANTRVADIAKRASTSPSLVLYHFESIEGVFRAVFEVIEDDFYRFISEAESQNADAVERMVVLSESSVSAQAVEQWWPIWVELWTESRRNAAIRELRTKLTEKWHGALRSCLLLGQRQGHFKQIDVNLTALRLAMFMDGIAITMTDRELGAGRNELSATWLESAAVYTECELLTERAKAIRGREIAH